jgi:hypothetical protein
MSLHYGAHRSKACQLFAVSCNSSLASVPAGCCGLWCFCVFPSVVGGSEVGTTVKGDKRAQQREAERTNARAILLLASTL